MPPPSACTKTAPPAAKTDYFSFELIPAATFAHGQNTIYVTLYDAFGQVAMAQVTITRPTNIRIAGVEVTQGIQTRQGFVLPQYVFLGLAPSAATLPGPGVFTKDHEYAGTRMILGGQTVVRVFLNHDGLGQIPKTGVTMLISGAVPRSDGSLRPIGALVIPEFTPASISSGPAGLTDAVRGDQRAAYTFTLPRSWHNEIAQAPGGWLDLRIKVSLNGITSITQCPGCAADDEVAIHHITMHADQMATPIQPVAVTFTDSAGVLQSPASPGAVFAQVEDVAPTTQDGFTVTPYIGTVDATDIIADRDAGKITGAQTTEAIFGRVAAFGSGVNPPSRRILGVMAAGINVRGVEKPVVYCCDFKPFPLPRYEPVAIAEEARPLQSLLHEHFHQYGFYHAGFDCPGVELATNWPPDQKGELQGFGLDRRSFRRAADLSYRVLTPTTANPYYDLMSYCPPTEDDTWISPFNWNRVGNPFPNGVIPDQLWLGQSTATIGGGGRFRGRDDDPSGTLPPAHRGRGILTISATVDSDDHVTSSRRSSCRASPTNTSRRSRRSGLSSLGRATRSWREPCSMVPREPAPPASHVASRRPSTCRTTYAASCSSMAATSWPQGGSARTPRTSSSSPPRPSPTSRATARCGCVGGPPTGTGTSSQSGSSTPATARSSAR